MPCSVGVCVCVTLGMVILSSVFKAGNGIHICTTVVVYASAHHKRVFWHFPVLRKEQNWFWNLRQSSNILKIKAWEHKFEMAYSLSPVNHSNTSQSRLSMNKMPEAVSCSFLSSWKFFNRLLNARTLQTRWRSGWNMPFSQRDSHFYQTLVR